MMKMYRMRKAIFPIMALCIVYGTQVLAQNQSGLGLSSDAPVQVDGDRLEIFEDKSQAVFNGNVMVVQGDTVLRTSKLTIHYAKGSQGSIATGNADIERLDAVGGINIQAGDQVATGETGTYNMRTETLVLKGNPVVLSEAGNVAKGCTLTVTQSNGRAKLEGCSSATRPTIQIQPRKSN